MSFRLGLTAKIFRLSGLRRFSRMTLPTAFSWSVAPTRAIVSGLKIFLRSPMIFLLDPHREEKRLGYSKEFYPVRQ